MKKGKKEQIKTLMNDENKNNPGRKGTENNHPQIKQTNE